MKKQVTFIVMILLSIFIAFMPIILGLSFTNAQSVALGIFSMAVLLWMTEAVPLHVTSFIILFCEIVFLFPILKESGVMKTPTAFYSPFFSDIIALFMGGFLLAKAGSKYHIDQWLSQTILRYSGKRGDFILLAMMSSAAVLSMWMSNTAATAMLLIIATRIIEHFKNDKKAISAFLIGIPFAANLGGMGTPVGTPPKVIALSLLQKHGVDISFLGWMLAILPIVILLFFFTWFLLARVYGFHKMQIEIDQKTETHFRWNRSSAFVVFIFVLTVSMWLFSKQIGISSGMVALIPLILFLSFNLLDKNDFRSISWDVLFLVGGGASLSVALDSSGLGEKLITLIPISVWGITITIIFFMLLAALMTSFMSNTAAANILIPLVFAMDKSSEGVAIAIIATLIMSSTMMFPVSTPPNALAYSSGLVDSRQMLKIGAVLAVVSMLAFFFVGRIWWHYLGFI